MTKHVRRERKEEEVEMQSRRSIGPMMHTSHTSARAETANVRTFLPWSHIPCRYVLSGAMYCTLTFLVMNERYSPVFHLSVRLPENAEPELLQGSNGPQSSILRCRNPPRQFWDYLRGMYLVQHVQLAWSTIRPFGGGEGDRRLTSP